MPTRKWRFRSATQETSPRAPRSLPPLHCHSADTPDSIPKNKVGNGLEKNSSHFLPIGPRAPCRPSSTSLFRCDLLQIGADIAGPFPACQCQVEGQNASPFVVLGHRPAEACCSFGAAPPPPERRLRTSHDATPAPLGQPSSAATCRATAAPRHSSAYPPSKTLTVLPPV
jgi:hypothetical protein